jgi:hypothetical protein
MFVPGFKRIVPRDWGGLQTVKLDLFQDHVYFNFNLVFIGNFLKMASFGRRTLPGEGFSASQTISRPPQSRESVPWNLLLLYQEIAGQLDSAQVAVKTCVEYHRTRLPAITSTWAPLLPHLDFVSEV